MIIYNIDNAPFIREMSDITEKLWSKGWAERNGGNISYLLKEEEVAPYLNVNDIKSETVMPIPLPELKNKIFSIYFIDLEHYNCLYRFFFFIFIYQGKLFVIFKMNVKNKIFY